jgi:hypothetical protein
LPSRKRDPRELAFDGVLSKSLDARRNSNSGITTSNRNTRRSEKNALPLVFLFLIGLTVASGLWFTNGYLWRTPISVGKAHHRAAIIDELSVTNPNASFIQDVKQSLTSSGYSIDYYPPDQVTVGLFQTLPSKDYGLIIIRSHTAANAGIITGERYSQGKYVYEQLTDQLIEGELQSGPSYFAIAAGFIGSEMQGQLPDSTIFLMGCDGLQGNPRLAEAFIDKGAKFVIGWDSAVTAYSTDVATAALLHGIAQGLTLSQAVGIAASYSDPITHGHLNSLSWQQVSGQRLDSFLYTMASWSTVVFFLVLGPSILILLPKILGRKWLDLSGNRKNRLKQAEFEE